LPIYRHVTQPEFLISKSLRSNTSILKTSSLCSISFCCLCRFKTLHLSRSGAASWQGCVCYFPLLQTHSIMSVQRHRGISFISMRLVTKRGSRIAPAVCPETSFLSGIQARHAFENSLRRRSIACKALSCVVETMRSGQCRAASKYMGRETRTIGILASWMHKYVARKYLRVVVIRGIAMRSCSSRGEACGKGRSPVITLQAHRMFEPTVTSFKSPHLRPQNQSEYSQPSESDYGECIAFPWNYHERVDPTVWCNALFSPNPDITYN
jgi:hypothetical protein